MTGFYVCIHCFVHCCFVWEECVSVYTLLTLSPGIGHASTHGMEADVIFAISEKELKLNCVVCPHQLEQHVSDKGHYNYLNLGTKKTHGTDLVESSAAELSQGTESLQLLCNTRKKEIFVVVNH